MDLDKLRALVELSRLGTMTAVATSTGYGTSAVSQQLAALERQVGTRLLESHGRRVRLTPAGRRLAEHGRTILAAVTAAELEGSARDEPHGPRAGGRAARRAAGRRAHQRAAVAAAPGAARAGRRVPGGAGRPARGRAGRGR